MRDPAPTSVPGCFACRASIYLPLLSRGRYMCSSCGNVCPGGIPFPLGPICQASIFRIPLTHAFATVCPCWPPLSSLCQKPPIVPDFMRGRSHRPCCRRQGKARTSAITSTLIISTSTTGRWANAADPSRFPPWPATASGSGC